MLLFDRGASLATCIQSGVVGVAMTISLGAALCPPPQAKPTSPPQPTAATPRGTLASIVLAGPSPEPLPMLEPLVSSVDCSIEPCLALTFDDGPDSRTTPQLLDTLALHGTTATFFMLGSQVTKHPDLARRVEQAGHEVGNHSWHHANFTKYQPLQMLEDISRAQKAFADAGMEAPTLFRPPFGARNAAVYDTVPLSLAYWNVDPKDWNALDSAHLADVVVASAKPGGIVVMHDIKPVTVAAAATFIPRLKQHYRLVTVSQLMDRDTDAPKTEIFGRK